MKNKILLSAIALITFFSSTAQQWEYVGDPGFNTEGFGFSGLEVSSDGTLYFMSSILNSSTEVWTYNNTDWELVGSSNFSGYTSLYQSSCISDNDSIYVSMSEWPVGEKASVMKFDGTDWVYIGNPGFSAGKAENTDIQTINDSVYVSFNDFSVNEKLSVMKYNGITWSYLGAQGFSDDDAIKPNMEIYNGAPYVAFQDMAVGGKMSVMRFDGFAWEYIGNQGFTPDAAGKNDLSIDANGTPYVSFSDATVGGKASVMKFDGINWVYAGSAGITSTTVGNTKIDFDELNRPHIAFRKTDGTNDVIVKIFDNVSWTSIGGTSAAPSGGSGIDFKVINYGNYYVSFSDYSVSGLKFSVVEYDLSSNTSELTNSNTFLVFPNPSNDIITIDNNGEAIEKVVVLNLSGQVILSGSDNTLDISELSNGVYLIKLLTKTGTKHSRFVKG